MAATLNGLRVITIKLFTPETRVWFADIDLDPDDVTQAPTSGPGTLLIDGVSLLGTIDPKGSAPFVASSSVRLVGGGMGWERRIKGQDFTSKSATTTADVYSATAELVGEKVVDSAPIGFGSHFVRMADPASAIFRDLDWYVDFAGVTQRASRPPAAPDPSLELLSFDPLEQSGEVACDVLVIPGTVISDPRLPGGAITIRDVEQTWSSKGIRAQFWAAASHVSRMRAAFAQSARDAVHYAAGRTYRYRFVLDHGDNTMAAQAITPGAPDLNPLSQWTGLSGLSATLAGPTELVVGFTADDPPQPYIASYSAGSKPVKAVLDASAEVDIGASAGSVVIGASLGAKPVTPAPFTEALTAGILAFTQQIINATPPSTDPALIAAATTLETLLTTGIGAFGPPATLIGKVA